MILLDILEIVISTYLKIRASRISFIYYLLFVEKDTLTPSRGNKDVFTLLKIHV